MEWVDILMDKFEGWVLDRVYNKDICGMKVDAEDRFRPECFCAIWHLKQLSAVKKYEEFRNDPEGIEKKMRRRRERKEEKQALADAQAAADKTAPPPNQKQ